jgi:hypothetical protein
MFFFFSGNPFIKHLMIKVLDVWKDVGEIPINLFAWMPTCLTVHLKTGTISLTVRNKLMMDKIWFNALTQSQSLIIHSIWTNAAKLASLNIYSNDIGNIVEFEGFSFTPGNLLAWNASIWQFNHDQFPSVKLITVSQSQVGGDINASAWNHILFVPVKMVFHEAIEMCKNLGNGTLSQFRSKKEMQDTWQEAKRVLASEVGSFLWTAYSREEGNQSNFVDMYNNQVINSDLWQPGQPNNQAQKCVHYDESGYNDMYCDELLPFACHMKYRHWHRLRGLCSDSPLDKFYFPDVLLGELVWIGIDRIENNNTFIRFNQSSYTWEAHVAGSDTFAYSEASYDSLLIGTHTWTVINDRHCDIGTSYTKQLSLTFCTDDEFNCDDGGCLPLDYWCDSDFPPHVYKNGTAVLACRDGSDEILCHSVEENPRYQGQEAPGSRQITNVEVHIFIQQIVDISVMTGKMRIKFDLSLEWLDPRLNFHGLWAEGEYNLLSKEELAFVWKPEFNFINIYQSDLDVLRAPTAYVYHYVNRTWKASDLSSLYNYQVFSGKDNMFHWTTKIR